MNDFFVLHAPGMFWTEPTPNGVTPTPRVGHAAALVGTKVFIFGGHDGKTCLNDVHVLVTMNWATLGAKGGRPSPRVSPTLTTVGHKLVMLGGAAHDKALNDVRIYNVEAAAWTVPTVGGTPPLALLDPWIQSAHFGAISPQVGGTPPLALCGHSATLVGTELFVFGGSDGKHAGNEVHIFDTETYALISKTSEDHRLPLRASEGL